MTTIRTLLNGLLIIGMSVCSDSSPSRLTTGQPTKYNLECDLDNAIQCNRRNETPQDSKVVQNPDKKELTISCPQGMANIDNRYCIDRYEAIVIDKNTGQEASPYYNPSYHGALQQFLLWKPRTVRAYPLPDLPAFEEQELFTPMAISRAGVYPQGFVDKLTAKLACGNAGKRLCTQEEWYQACIGPKRHKHDVEHFIAKFPYGPRYEHGKCNFNIINAHPLLVVGRSASGLDDPRLGLAAVNGTRLLAKTGEYSACTNAYGVYDMVGNQDEIVDDPEGGYMVFMGSFYARLQKDGPLGCASRLGGHAEFYYDYSIGFRCCADISSKILYPKKNN